jgi:hypothetical protein
MTAIVITLGSSLAYSQKTDSLKPIASPVNRQEENFIITVSNDSLSVKFDNNRLPVRTTQELDDYLKHNVQNIDEKRVLVQSGSNTKNEKIEAVDIILRQNKIEHCPHLRWLEK